MGKIKIQLYKQTSLLVQMVWGAERKKTPGRLLASLRPYVLMRVIVRYLTILSLTEPVSRPACGGDPGRGQSRLWSDTSPSSALCRQLVSSVGSASSMVRSDAESLVASEEVPSRQSVVSELEPMFRPIRVTPAIVVHMVILVSTLHTVAGI